MTKSQQRIADARDDLPKINPKLGVEVTDEQMDEYRQECTVFCILNHETIQFALALADKILDEDIDAQSVVDIIEEFERECE